MWKGSTMKTKEIKWSKPFAVESSKDFFFFLPFQPDYQVSWDTQQVARPLLGFSWRPQVFFPFSVLTLGKMWWPSQKHLGSSLGHSRTRHSNSSLIRLFSSFTYHCAFLSSAATQSLKSFVTLGSDISVLSDIAPLIEIHQGSGA